ncbi:hypothetical protein [Bacillus sp. 03113]|uniref:hypothetical protein n=1 Tax=Bacillus sp. 03113 TaxID=2578211 RepID=UPI001143A024|nr:hypothetical protein [Bacillus sp. 03113]
MRIQLTRKHTTIFFISFLLIMLIFSSLYYFYLRPQKIEIINKQNQLQKVKMDYALLKASFNQKNTDTDQSTKELQRKVPVKPLLDQVILDIEKAEMISNSFVSQMSIQDSSQSKDFSQATGQNKTKAELDLEKKATNQNDQQTESTFTLPNGMSKITITCNIESPNYFQLEKFINSLEEMERIYITESLSFNGPVEATSLQSEKEKLSYSLVISVLYLPLLTDLEKDLPKIETPPSSHKRNPLYQSPNLDND